MPSARQAPLVRRLFAGAVAGSAYIISTPELRADHLGDNTAETSGVNCSGRPALRT